MSIYAVASHLTAVHARSGVFPVPLPLTAAERKFARRAGWGGIEAKRRPHAEAVRPDGITCGIFHAIRSIRRARTLSFLSAS